MNATPTYLDAAEAPLLVTDAESRLIGALNMHDLFTAKVI